MGMITREMMATWYRGLDVLSMCSYAEGFGLPLIEAQACGTPVITTDGSSMSELCGAGWLVSGTPFWTNGHGAWWKRPDADDIEQAYEVAWQAREDGTLPKKPARDFALLYSADRVFEQFWVPVLKELEARFG
jgi:glycosyltransferase involved in cell wall biosynthesis